MSRWQRVVLWASRQQKAARAWIFRGVTFYFGYRVLHHEVYETETSEPLLIVFGLWLCGIAPATFLDSLRKGAAAIQSEMEKVATSTKATDPPPDDSSGIGSPKNGKVDGASP